MSTVQQAFVVNCPSCGKRLQVPPHLAGKRAKCSCGQSIAIPTMAGLPAQAAGSATDARSVPLGYRAPAAPADDAPPAPSPKRKALIDWVNQWHEGTSTLPMSDVGQKYLLVRLRL